MSKFQPGKSGNPTGRPKGIQDRRLALRKLLEAHTDALIQQAVQLALDGDTTALKLCLERIMPPVKPTQDPVEFEAEGETLADQGRAIIKAMGGGIIAPDQAASLLNALAAQAKLVELEDIEQRLSRLEGRIT